jgi:hypothetical protein
MCLIASSVPHRANRYFQVIDAVRRKLFSQPWWRTSTLRPVKAARPSIEGDANPGFFAPNSPALPGHLIGLNDQPKFVGNAERTWNVKGGADL